MKCNTYTCHNCKNQFCQHEGLYIEEGGEETSLCDRCLQAWEEESHGYTTKKKVEK